MKTTTTLCVCSDSSKKNGKSELSSHTIPLVSCPFHSYCVLWMYVIQPPSQLIERKGIFMVWWIELKMKKWPRETRTQKAACLACALNKEIVVAFSIFFRFLFLEKTVQLSHATKHHKPVVSTHVSLARVSNFALLLVTRISLDARVHYYEEYEILGERPLLRRRTLNVRIYISS